MALILLVLILAILFGGLGFVWQAGPSEPGAQALASQRSMQASSSSVSTGLVT